MCVRKYVRIHLYVCMHVCALTQTHYKIYIAVIFTTDPMQHLSLHRWSMLTYTHIHTRLFSLTTRSFVHKHIVFCAGDRQQR